MLLEHLVHHEIRSHLHYANVKGSLGFWRTPGGSEVDFVWWRGKDVVAIEVKHGREYRRAWRKSLDALATAMPARRFIVYTGARELDDEGAQVLPLETFLRRLHRGDILG